MGINSFPPTGGAGNYEFPGELIDPVSKFRVSQPENLIDTDFEYGLQPTKWETVELINNTPSFFSKSGDTTIDGISSIITNAGTREIIVKTELDHGLAVGIPINVTGTKSITADGSYIINSIPDTKTFTYLCKDDQDETASILDLYSSIITGEFFQGSQLRVSDSDGIVTDAEGTSELTVTTNSTHGFGVNTPFYFLNLNSTVAQEFQAANTASKTFDASNSATAQTFDGSNTLSSFNIDWSNSATQGGVVSNITSSDLANSRITVSHTTENFSNLPVGTPLYYSVSATSGYFNTNPRGVVFLKTTTSLGTSTSTFQVSLVPDGEPILFTTSISGTFQIANQARTFAGNNQNPLTQTSFTVIKNEPVSFDGGNQGFAGELETNGFSTITEYNSSLISLSTVDNEPLDYYVGSMVRYNTTLTPAGTLVDGETYFVHSITGSPGTYQIQISQLPGENSSPITFASNGTGVQTLQSIGVSTTKDIVHVKNANFLPKDMIEYSFPAGGRFTTETEGQSKLFYFVEIAYDAHNYKLGENFFTPVAATGGIESTYTSFGTTYKVHAFTTVGSSNFVVTSPGTLGTVDVLVVAGGGGGGAHVPGGGGAGGLVYRPNKILTAGTYPVVIGSGGLGSFNPGNYVGQPNATAGGDSTALGLTAKGGGWGLSWFEDLRSANGGSGGGREGRNGSRGLATQPTQAGESGTFGFGNPGGNGIVYGNDPYPGSGGGGAGGSGGDQPNINTAGNGGAGRYYGNIFGTSYGQNGWFAGGGGGGSWGFTSGGRGQGGIGGGGDGDSPTGNGSGPSARGAGNTPTGVSGLPNTGGGGGGAGKTGGEASRGGNGGSGIVLIRYQLTESIAISPMVASGGTETLETDTNLGIQFKVHTFSTPGQSSFVVNTLGSVPEFEVFAYGAGGGGGQPGGWSFGALGGAGGYASGQISLSSPKTYAIMVGGGGANAEGTNNGVDSQQFTAGGGGPSKPSGFGDDRYGAQGGGLSGIFDNNTYNAANAILIAGGGGGGGSSRAGTGNTGGAGGGSTGQDGSAPYDGQVARRGRGGRQTGPTDLPQDGNNIAPGQLTGGATPSYGGGGGGGWWGGSAGTYSESNTMGGGGGGSGYLHPTKVNGAIAGGSGQIPPAGIPKPTSVAVGGNISSPGGNGLVVIRYPVARVS